MDFLNVKGKVNVDSAITNFQFRSYKSYTTGELNHNDECRLVIQQQDLITIPGLSELRIQGKLLKYDESGVSTKVQLINNFIAFLFEEIRYELGGITIDRVINPGITTSMKGYVSYTPSEHTALMFASWVPFDNENINNAATGEFDVCYPLSSILGFAEDFKKIIVNCRQQLVLRRTADDLNATIEKTRVQKGKITNLKITWSIPHITVSDYEKLKLLETTEKNIPLEIAYRRWELFRYPQLPETHSFTWVLKSSTFLEKPRFVIFGFQTDRNNNLTKDASKFDHCNLKNIKLYLNSQSYPYENLNF